MLESRIRQLERMLDTVEKENHALMCERDGLVTEVENLKVVVSSQAPEPKAKEEVLGQEEMEDISEGALRKRLWRLCKRQADGKLVTHECVMP